MDLEMEKIDKWLFDLIWEEAQKRDRVQVGFHTNRNLDSSSRIDWKFQKETLIAGPAAKTNQQIFKGGF